VTGALTDGDVPASPTVAEAAEGTPLVTDLAATAHRLGSGT
jgi:hypothetical protein